MQLTNGSSTERDRGPDQGRDDGVGHLDPGFGDERAVLDGVDTGGDRISDRRQRMRMGGDEQPSIVYLVNDRTQLLEGECTAWPNSSMPRAWPPSRPGS
jgi:hypothetical protein